MNPRSKKVMDYVIEKVSRNGSRDPGHDLNHILRVYEAGVQIGKEEGANMEILEPALLLHDIVRPTLEGEEKHAMDSANLARNILPSFGYSPEEINAIAYAIQMHSRSSKQEGAKSLEARIVYDADKQDGLGHAGIARALMLGEARGYNLEETASWYLKRIIDVAKNEPLYTEAGKRMARKKLEISLEFCRKILGRKYYEILKKELDSFEVRI